MAPFTRIGLGFSVILMLCAVAVSGCGLRDKDGSGRGNSACVEAGERICAAACDCGGCAILGRGTNGATVRVESDDEASCVEGYSDRCETDERTDDELTACADAYATTECSDGAAVQPDACVAKP